MAAKSAPLSNRKVEVAQLVTILDKLSIDFADGELELSSPAVQNAFNLIKGMPRLQIKDQPPRAKPIL